MVPAAAAVTDTPLKSYPETLEGCILWLDNRKGIALLLEDQIYLSTESRRQQGGHAGRTSSCPPAMTYKEKRHTVCSWRCQQIKTTQSHLTQETFFTKCGIIFPESVYIPP